MNQYQIKIMLWNCCGAGNNAFVHVFNHYIRENQPTMLIIMKTRIEPGILCKKFSQLGFDGYEHMENTGFEGGGIAIRWKKEKIQIRFLQKTFLVFTCYSQNWGRN